MLDQRLKFLLSEEAPWPCGHNGKRDLIFTKTLRKVRFDELGLFPTHKQTCSYWISRWLGVLQASCAAVTGSHALSTKQDKFGSFISPLSDFAMVNPNLAAKQSDDCLEMNPSGNSFLFSSGELFMFC